MSNIPANLSSSGPDIVSGWHKVADNRARNVIERVTGAFSEINTDHQYIHEGIAFKTELYLTTLAHSTTATFSLVTPESKYLHLKDMSLNATAATVKLTLVRGTADSPLVLDSAGTAATEILGPNNVNDVSQKVTGVVIKKNPTYVTGQDGEDWDYMLASGTATNQVRTSMNTSNSPNFEYVLKPATPYVLKLQNMSGSVAATDVLLSMFWYEEDGA